MEMGLRSSLNVDIFVVGVSLWMNQKHTISQRLSANHKYAKLLGDEVFGRFGMTVLKNKINHVKKNV